MSMRKRKQTLIIVAVAAVLLMAFSLLGRIIAPSWQPVDSTATVTLDSSDTSIAANNAVNAAIDTYDVDEQTVTVHVGDGVTVNAIVRTPRQPQWRTRSGCRLRQTGRRSAGSVLASPAPVRPHG